MIDFHVHIGRMYRDQYPAMLELTPHQLVDRMNREGVDLSVLLGLESPEGSWGYLLTEDIVAARDLYPERLVGFVGVDPRYPRTKQHIHYFVEQHGCRGVGELVCGLAFDDPLCHEVYAACDELGLPLVFESNSGYLWDEPGLPRLEACLKQYPNCCFVGHGPGWWSAISADDPRGGYPPGRIVPGGAIERLMEAYDNLYCDLSAGSGYNAMTRDPDFTPGFIARHWRKLLFGTDFLRANEPIAHFAWLRGLGLDEEVFEAIADGNARRLLRLDGKG